MKILLSLMLWLFSVNVFAVEALNFKEVELMFNNGEYPFIDAHVGAALSGRCVHKFNAKKIQPTVVLVSFGEKGFEIAPITFSDKKENYFDDMTWADVFNNHPEVNAQFMEVVDLQNEIGVYKKELLGDSSAIIRESGYYFVFKIFRNNKFIRYCYYKKSI